MEENSYLSHHGIKGQRWGVRRFQNEDGTLTEAGRKRLGNVKDRTMRTLQRREKFTKYAIESNKETIKDLKENGVLSESAKEHWNMLDSDARKELVKRSDYGKVSDILLDMIFEGAPGAKHAAMKQLVKEDIASLTKENKELVSAGKQYAERYNTLSTMDVNALAEKYGYKEAKRQVKSMKRIG